jgi:multimeric flavodoxin WrbA
MAEALAEGVKEAGNTAVIWNAGQKKLTPCIACNNCYKKPGKACYNDDTFNELAALIEKGDAVVFATPLYFSTFSAQIKLAIDHMYSMGGSSHKLDHVKKAVLLASAMSPESAFKCLTDTYKQMIGGIGWQDAGIVIAPSIMNEAALKKSGALEKARAIGKVL